MRLPDSKPFSGCAIAALCLLTAPLGAMAAEAPPAPSSPPSLSSIVDRMVAKQEALAHELNAYQFLEQIDIEALGRDNATRRRSRVVVQIRPNSHALILTDAPGDEKAKRAAAEAEVKQARRGIETVYSFRKAVPRFHVVLLGHGNWHGEPAYRLAFAGKPDEPYRTPLEKLLNHVHGQMHVSARDYSILETQAFLAEPVNVAWFLVRFEHLDFFYVAQRISPLGYVPKTVTFHYQVRIPFASRHERQHIELVDYRRAKPTETSAGP
ncbi:hypothetical protein MAMC_00456 [Methylacidimicrobium cyclopophantes]|uniref:DUF1571 domain-containing protein n=1 Tax=Methylacidimicrobium cyclopophantes TaxID=1041766 RepID=A0A5E6MA07_9BACT|nr:hypothetical protein [Methylacidimicrobium cyclopophantes]VVM05184.1 hypothetical protein MAMC_00456 [Methylacidimicrobium cyclopophantes]